MEQPVPEQWRVSDNEHVKRRRRRELSHMALLAIGLGSLLLGPKLFSDAPKSPNPAVQIRVTHSPTPPTPAISGEEESTPIEVTVRQTTSPFTARQRAKIAIADATKPWPTTHPGEVATETSPPSLPLVLGRAMIDGHEIIIHPKIAGDELAMAMGCQQIAVSIDGRDDHLLLDTDRFSSIDVPGNAIWHWDDTKQELELIYNGARLVYRWNGNRMALANVNYLHPSEAVQLKGLAADAYEQKVIELLRGTNTRHKRCEAVARATFDCIVAKDWERLVQLWLKKHPNQSLAEAERYAQQQRIFLEKYSVDVNALEFDPTFIYHQYYPSFVLNAESGIRLEARPDQARLATLPE